MLVLVHAPNAHLGTALARLAPQAFAADRTTVMLPFCLLLSQLLLSRLLLLSKLPQSFELL